MTIAISLKVNDGVVLAADSASTILIQTATGTGVAQVFNNANKVFNLRKGLPIGLITWGAGSIGRAAISTLAKDLRVRLTGPDPDHKDWHIDPDSYTLQEVALSVKRFMFDEHYNEGFKGWAQKPPLGFIIAGYSAGANLAEEFRLDIDAQGDCSGPTTLRPPEECGLTWNGEPEAISRIILGHSPRMERVLEDQLGVDPSKIPDAMKIITRSLQANVVYDAMPMQDAIDLAEFLVDLTEKYSRYTPGAATVGGPIEVAAITKHEGFRWVRRKLYFSREYNPEVTA